MSAGSDTFMTKDAFRLRRIFFQQHQHFIRNTRRVLSNTNVSLEAFHVFHSQVNAITRIAAFEWRILYDFYEQAEHKTSQFARDAMRLDAFEARLQLLEVARVCPWNFSFRQAVQNPYDFSSI